jgi:16S rRNA (uracil1498-N3)-methyltransferase
LQRITIDPTQIHDRQIALNVEQHHYLTRAIRLKHGDQFEAIDGTGMLYLAKIDTETNILYSPQIAAGNATIIEIIAAPDRTFLPEIILICALPKGNNFDDIVRACTELGVAKILPVISDRTLLNPSPQKLQRWRKIAQEAAEQSERLVVPIIHEPEGLKTLLGELPHSACKYWCEARGQQPHLLTYLQSSQLIDPLDQPIVIAIGPEGGWTSAEIQLAIEHDFRLVSLGARILRTVTAPIVALAIITAAIEATAI